MEENQIGMCEERQDQKSDHVTHSVVSVEE